MIIKAWSEYFLPTKTIIIATIPDVTYVNHLSVAILFTFTLVHITAIATTVDNV